MKTIKTTLICSNCGAPIDFKNYDEKCPYCDSPYTEEILSQMREEQAAKNREANKRAWEAYEEEQIRLSKLPKASTFFGLNLLFGAFGAHWLFVKCWFKAFMDCAFTVLCALSLASDYELISIFLAFYIFVRSSFCFPYVANNVLEKTDGVEFNVDLKMKPKRKWQKYQIFKGEANLMLFSFIFRMCWIGIISTVLSH